MSQPRTVKQLPVDVIIFRKRCVGDTCDDTFTCPRHRASHVDAVVERYQRIAGVRRHRTVVLKGS